MASPLLKSTMPICSVERARELGLDLEKVHTCHPMKQNGVLGCPYWKVCRFDREKYGGFKGTRPHIVGYFLRTFGGGTKVDHISCFNFIASGLQNRMDDSLMAQQKGEKHETVKIVAQEGEPIKVKRFPQEVGKDGTLRTKTVPQQVAVPQFPDPEDLDEFMEYERDLLAEFDSDFVETTSQPAGPALAQPVERPLFGKGSKGGRKEDTA